MREEMDRCGKDGLCPIPSDSEDAHSAENL